MKFALFIILLAFSSTVQAQVVQLDSLIQGKPVGAYMSYWVDKKGDAEFEQVLAHDWWINIREDVPNMGVSSYPHWFKLDVQVPAGQSAWLMEIGYALLDFVDVYVVTAEGQLIQHDAVGMQRPISNRPIQHRYNIIPLPDSHNFYQIFIRVESFHSVQLPLAFWTQADFVAHDEFNNLAVGMLAGALCIMLLYNFFLYTTIREPIYLAYVGAVASFLVLQFGLKGFGYRYLWHDYGSWSSVVVFLSGFSAIFFATTFAAMFLQLKERGYRYYSIVSFFRWFSLVGLVATPWLPPQWVLLLLAALAMLIISLGFNAVFTYIRTGDRPIYIFTVAWTVFLIGVLLILFNKFGVIPVNIWTEQTISFGTVFEMVLFSMALGDRINSEKEHTLQAKQKLLGALNKEREAKQRILRSEEMERNAKEITLKIQTENNEKLEKEVAIRTQKLNSAKEQLQTLVRIDPLTQLLNRHYFNEQIPEEFRRCARERTHLTLMMVDIDHFKSINDKYGHLVGDQCLTKVAAVLDEMGEQGVGSAYRYGGEEFSLLFPGMSLFHANKMAESIRVQMAEHITGIANGPNAITVSIGVVSVVPAVGLRPEVLIGHADAALYEAKRLGRNRVVVSEFDGSEQRAAH